MADTKITALTADTSPTSTDLIVTVDDVSGTPTNKKVTLAAVTTLIRSAPCCKINFTGPLSIAANVVTPIPFATADSYDTDTMHDTTTNNTRITINTAGVYALTATLEYAVATGSARFAWFRVNGATRIGGASAAGIGGGLPNYVNTAEQVKLAAADYVEVIAFTGTLCDLDLAEASATLVALG